MTTSTSLSGGMARPTAPERGSFPLDHLSECRRFAHAYRKCLERNSGTTSACRQEAREYLKCRMQKGLMAVDDWHNLGLSQDSIGTKNPPEGNESKHPPQQQNQQPQGRPAFVAGIKTARARQKKTDQQA